jgi:Glyoxalase/Bleomycin resistance protein/Dioxygenase superfamily
MNAATLSPGTISQVCYATFDLQAAAKRWARLTGAGPFFVMDLPAEIEKTYRGKPAKDTFRAAIGFMGKTCIELMQPTNEAPSIVREILDARGEGAVQHIYPQIRPLDATQYDAVCAGYREQGLEEALSFKLAGLGRNAFYDATQSLGCFIEVLEVGEAAYHTVLGGMYEAHRNWDGNEIFHSMESLTERRIG